MDYLIQGGMQYYGRATVDANVRRKKGWLVARAQSFPILAPPRSSSGVLVGQGLPHGGPCFWGKVLYLAGLNHKTMNATERLVKAANGLRKYVGDALEVKLADGHIGGAIKAGRLCDNFDQALAAAKEERGNGLDVEWVMLKASETLAPVIHDDDLRIRGIENFRKALEARSNP